VIIFAFLICHAWRKILSLDAS